MTMRAPASDLPIMFVEAGILAGAVAILDDISLSIGPGRSAPCNTGLYRSPNAGTDRISP
jgi:hypothetical protein